MANIISSKCIMKYPTGLIFRIFNHKIISQNCLKISTSKIFETKIDRPTKYSTNKAARLEIAETLGFKEAKEEFSSKVSKMVMFTSLVIFMIYFLILREENDIDEFLTAGSEKLMIPEVMKLKMDLKYCEKMNLPTDALKRRIEELESEVKVKSPFIK